MARVRIQVATGRPAFQVDDFDAGVPRSREGAIYFRPGAVLTVTTEELEHVRERHPELEGRLRVLGWIKETGVTGDTPRETPSPARLDRRPHKAFEASEADKGSDTTGEAPETAGDAATGSIRAPEATETPSSSTEEVPPADEEAGTGESDDSTEEADKESGKGKRKRRRKKKY